MQLQTRARYVRRCSAALLLAMLASAFAGRSTAEDALPVLDFAEALGTAEALPRLHSLLVSWRGERVLERYFHGRDGSELANVKSVSKSIVSALVGVAIERGLIAGVDQPIADFFPEVADDPVRGRITIENLLTMQAGLETTSNRNYGRWVQSDDWVGFALAQPVVAESGGSMIYSTGNTHLLSAILTRASGADMLSFAREAFSPLGFELAPWPADPAGIYFGGNDMELTPRQMLAFGELYLNDGLAGAERVVPAAWIEASLEPRAESPREEGRYYGYGWWIREMAGFDVPYAWGFGGQFIVLVPALELVVVTTSSSWPGDDRRQHTRRIYDLVEHQVIASAARDLRRSAAAN